MLRYLFSKSPTVSTALEAKRRLQFILNAQGGPILPAFKEELIKVILKYYPDAQKEHLTIVLDEKSKERSMLEVNVELPK